MKKSIKELQALLTPCECGEGPFFEHDGGLPTSYPDDTKHYRAECLNCGKSGLWAISLEDAMRIWNASLFEE